MFLSLSGLLVLTSPEVEGQDEVRNQEEKVELVFGEVNSQAQKDKDKVGFQSFVAFLKVVNQHSSE